MSSQIDMMPLTRLIPLVISIASMSPVIGFANPPGGARPIVVEAPLEAETSESRVHLHIEAATELPLFVGARMQVLLPERLHLGVGLGALPDGLLDLTAGVASRVGGLDEPSVALVQEGLSDGWMAKVYAGWTPFPNEALYLQVGYGYLGLNGSLSSAQVASLDGLQQLAAFPGTAVLGSGVHALEAELGFRWAIDDLRIRLSFGLTAALASNSTLQFDAAGLPPAEAARLGPLVAGVLDDGIQSYGYLPTVGLGIGYDLGL